VSDQITLEFDVRRNGDDAILIGDDIRIVVVQPKSGDSLNKVRIGMEAPKSIPIHREEARIKHR